MPAKALRSFTDAMAAAMAPGGSSERDIVPTPMRTHIARMRSVWDTSGGGPAGGSSGGFGAPAPRWCVSSFSFSVCRVGVRVVIWRNRNCCIREDEKTCYLPRMQPLAGVMPC